MSRMMTMMLHALVAGTFLVATGAEARVEHLRWYQDNHVEQGTSGFRLYKRAPGGAWTAPEELSIGSLAVNANGVFSHDIDVPDDATVIVKISAFNADGESPLSSELHLQPETTGGGEPSGSFLGNHDFESFTSDTVGWTDTGAYNSLVEDASVYGVKTVDSSRVLYTDSTLANTHSHITPDGSVEGWRDYEYAGRLRKSASNGGIGFTAYSEYPTRDAYYRVRSSDGGPFHLASHPDGAFTIACTSETTNVSPSPDIWYRFKMRVETHDSYTSLVAKVWRDGTTEPASWQIDCTHSESSRLTSGTVGVWAMRDGEKYWDDLTVESLAAGANAPPPPVLLED